MTRHKLPINTIVVEDRQRRDLGDIDELAASIKAVGLIQPIVVNQDKRLLVGGRRLAACTALGMTEIDVVYRETLSQDELFEIELEENIRRKDMTWQERCLCTAKIHRLKRAQARADGEEWGVRQTGEMLGVSKSHAHYCLIIAHELEMNPDSPVWKEASLADAWRLVLRKAQEADEAELAKRTAAHVLDELPLVVVAPMDVVDLPDPVKEEARERYLANRLNDPAKFDEYYASKQAPRSVVINLSMQLFKGDCIEYMNTDEFKQGFDHIVTDIPYGIEMNNLKGDNVSSFVDLDTVEEEHDVEQNIALMARFFPAAFRCIKSTGFCVVWCDQDLWEYMRGLAENVGFKVQRWPLTWVKTHRCRNQAAQFNYTKTTEIAMVCRKGNAVLVDPSITSVVVASNEEAKKEFGHVFAKPAECWSLILEHISFQGQSILDPFAGRGSGVVTALRLGRRAFGIEINDAHYNALLENVKKHYIATCPNVKFI